MSTSAAQLTANQANAQLSTGPRTEEGKHASSSNAVTTGLTAAQIFVRPDEQPAFLEFQSSLMEEMQPHGAVQSHFFDIILHAAWNIRRCHALETQIQNEAIIKGFEDALLDDELSRKLDRIYRYKKMHEASQRRAIGDLRKLQSEELWRRENQAFLEDSIVAETPKILLRLRQINVSHEKSDLRLIRQQIETYIAPPPSLHPDLH